MTLDDTTIAQATKHLAHVDPVLAPIIEQAGLCTIRPHTNYYQALVESIIGQQLSVKAAASIRTKFMSLYVGDFPTPTQILATDIDDLRGVGFSRAKALYVHDLAQHVVDGKLDFDNFETLSNQAIVNELVNVKGIGEWTAHMFLMFCMGRSDVLPYGDLGVRSGIKLAYNLAILPDKTTVEAIATQYHWHPYESVASWYMWQSLDNAPK